MCIYKTKVDTLKMKFWMPTPWHLRKSSAQFIDREQQDYLRIDKMTPGNQVAK